MKSPASQESGKTLIAMAVIFGLSAYDNSVTAPASYRSRPAPIFRGQQGQFRAAPPLGSSSRIPSSVSSGSVVPLPPSIGA